MTPPGPVCDLYHLDTIYVAWREGLTGRATFDLYARRAPFDGAYLVAAGLEPALDAVRSFGFSDDDVAYVASVRGYDEAFLRVLRSYRFGGDVHAMPEGTIAFPDEPLLRVTAPFGDALVLESAVMRLVSLSTVVATKAARVVDAAGGRPVAEFGLRRAHEPSLAARAAAIGGCASTSYVGAARRWGIAPSGTIPHAVIQAFPTERAAFAAVAEALPEYSLLLDTYDVHAAIDTAVEVARDAAARGHVLRSVRLDSGDIAADARHVRAVLDGAALTEVRIVASGDLDEHGVAALVSSGAPIDAFGVGTSIAIGAGPGGGALACAYKLAWVEGGTTPVKLAPDKRTWPGRKQVFRAGLFAGDLIALEDEPPPPGARPLLERVVRDGLPVLEPEPLDAARARALEGLAALPDPHRRLEAPEPYPVERSGGLVRLREEAARAHRPG